MDLWIFPLFTSCSVGEANMRIEIFLLSLPRSINFYLAKVFELTEKHFATTFVRFLAYPESLSKCCWAYREARGALNFHLERYHFPKGTFKTSSAGSSKLDTEPTWGLVRFAAFYIAAWLLDWALLQWYISVHNSRFVSWKSESINHAV